MTLHRMVNGRMVLLTPEEEQAQLDEWNRNAQREAERRLQAEVDRKRAAAMRALEDQQLAEAIKDPEAPQPVKDYAAALTASTR